MKIVHKRRKILLKVLQQIMYLIKSRLCVNIRWNLNIPMLRQNMRLQ